MTMHGEIATRAAGLHDYFQKDTTLLALRIAIIVFSMLEELNRSFQCKSGTLSGMLQAVKTTDSTLDKLRTDDVFQDLFESVEETVMKLDMTQIGLHRQRRPPGRITEMADAHKAEMPVHHFRPIFFAIVDTARNQLGRRLDENSPNIKRYMTLEQMLLTGEMNTDVCAQYPELKDVKSLEIQLRMFHRSYNTSSLCEAQELFKKMAPEMRALFYFVEQLVRLLLLYPVSSCTAEWSFSALRRLKTWIRSTMSERRLNTITVCHVNKHILENLNMNNVAKEFASRTDMRMGVFGSFDNG